MWASVGPIAWFTLTTAISELRIYCDTRQKVAIVIGGRKIGRNWGYSIVYIKSTLAGPNAQGQRLSFNSIEHLLFAIDSEKDNAKPLRLQ